jgi:anti-sigma B factor antagonist
MTATMPARTPSADRPLLVFRTTVRDASLVEVAASGDLDMSTSPQLQEALLAALAAHRPSHLMVDMAEVGFVDSSGLSALMHCRNVAERDGITLRVTNVQPLVRRVIMITGLVGPLLDPADRL